MRTDIYNLPDDLARLRSEGAFFKMTGRLMSGCEAAVYLGEEKKEIFFEIKRDSEPLSYYVLFQKGFINSNLNGIIAIVE